MLIIHCPVCGVEGEEGDFHCGGQAHIARPATTDPENITDEAQRDYLFMRFNPKGLHFERWRCDRGCGKWFHAARDTTTMQFKGYYPITELPPRELIDQATGLWKAFFAERLKAAAPEKPAAKKKTATSKKPATPKKSAPKKTAPRKRTSTS